MVVETTLVRGPLSDIGVYRLNDFLMRNAKQGVDENYKRFYDIAYIIIQIEEVNYTMSIDVDNLVTLTGSYVLPASASNTDMDLTYVLSASDFEFSLQETQVY